MKLNAVSVFDKKTQMYDSRVNHVVHVGELVREFEDLKKDEQTKFGKHPEDFELRLIGTFDRETGLFESVAPVQLA